MALVLSLLIAAFLGTARNAAADESAPLSPAAGAVADATTPTVPAGAATAAQDAATTQGANGAAVAGDLSQANAIGTGSDSGGGSATASQANAVTSNATAANTAATSQTASQGSTAPTPAPASGGSAGAQDSTQSANTTQNAGAVATATGIQQINVIIVIRINSPGDDVLSQANVVNAVASAANNAATSQNSPLPVAAGTPAPGQRDGSSTEPGSAGTSAAPTGGSAGTAAPAAQSAVPEPVAAAEQARPQPALSAARASAGTLQLLAIAAAAARAQLPGQTQFDARGVQAHSAPNRAPVAAGTSRPRNDVTEATTSSPPAAVVAGATGGSSGTPPTGLQGHDGAALATAPATPVGGNASTAPRHLAASAQLDDAQASAGLMTLGSLVVALLVGVLALAAMTFGPALTSRLRF